MGKIKYLCILGKNILIYKAIVYFFEIQINVNLSRNYRFWIEVKNITI